MDRHAIEQLGIPGYTLMTRAAEAAFAVLREKWPTARRIVVVCGVGNNAGDGYVLARLAIDASLKVVVLSVAETGALHGDAARAYEDFIAAGGTVQSWHADALRDAEVIVDALFGTGLSRPLDATLCACVAAINAMPCPVLSLDIPSGLHADSGAVMGAAVTADVTVSFVGLKQGFYVGEGQDHTGELHFSALDIPAFVAEQMGAVAVRLDTNVIAQALPRRPRTSHKGRNGHVLIVGGGIGMAGAVRLSGEACLRVGAGLVSIATRAEHASMLLATCPELMCRGVMLEEELLPLIEKADVIAIGPGLGQDAWARELLTAVLASDKPLVVDADALNLLAQRRGAKKQSATRHWILTPHPGEAARLLNISTAQIQADRLGKARELQQRYSGTIVLKGAGTIVCDADALPAICDRGNPGMAAPGMGDVLTGVIAGVLAQTGSLSLAARAGVLLHAIAGDMAAGTAERGLLASDLFPHLRHCANIAPTLDHPEHAYS